MASNDMALAALGNPSFSQQGQLDWVALANSAVTSTVGILGRISAAGIEPITVATGQALCSQIQPGVLGQKRLADAVSDLTTFPSFGNLIWFGTGVRHILPSLVQTTEGVALCSLAACLSEGFSSVVAAHILFELARSSKAPSLLSPAIQQWQQLVEVCAPIYAGSPFGNRVNMLLQLSRIRDAIYAPNPQEMAEILLALGSITQNKTESIHVAGGSGCAWLAALCDFALNLRIQVFAEELVFQNHPPQLTPQVTIQFQSSVGSIVTTRQSFKLPDPLSIYWQIITEAGPPVAFPHMRVPWETLLKDLFPAVMIRLDVNSSFKTLFVTLFQLSIWGMFKEKKPTFPLPPMELAKEALARLPELACLEAEIGDALSNFCSLERTDLSEKYREMIGSVEDFQVKCCDCECMIALALILTLVKLDTTIEISRAGVRLLSDHFEENRRKYHLNVPDPKQAPSGPKERPRPVWHEIHPVLPWVATLFSGSPHETQGQDFSDHAAISRSGIYCYQGSVMSVTSNLQEAIRIHVGAGTIERNHKRYPWVKSYHDPERRFNFQDPDIHEPQVLRNTHNDDLAGLFGAQETQEMEIEAMVEVRQGLHAWYRSKHLHNGNGILTPHDIPPLLEMATVHLRNNHLQRGLLEVPVNVSRFASSTVLRWTDQARPPPKQFCYRLSHNCRNLLLFHLKDGQWNPKYIVRNLRELELLVVFLTLLGLKNRRGRGMYPESDRKPFSTLVAEMGAEQLQEAMDEVIGDCEFLN